MTDVKQSDWQEFDLDADFDENEDPKVEGGAKDIEVKEEPKEELPENVEIEPEEGESAAEEDTPVDEPTLEDVSKKAPSRSEARIRELVRQRKEVEAQKDAEIAALRAKLQESDKKTKEYRTNEVEARKNSAKSRLDSLKKEYTNAVIDGDAEKMAEINSKMTEANVELMVLDSYEGEKEDTKPVEQPRAQPQQGTVRDNVIAKLPDQGREWAKKHKWFAINPKLTQEAVGFAAEIEAEGFMPEEPEYWQELDKRLAEEYPNRFGKKEEPAMEEPEEPKRKPKSPVSSGRTPPATKPGTVRLTRDEVERAKLWGVPLEEYARQKKKLEKAEQDPMGGTMTQIFEE